MDRERDAYQRMRDNTRQSAQYAEVCDAPPTPRIKPNYLSAMVWTSVVAAVVCTIFMGLLLYVVNESKLEDRLEKAATQALSGLEFVKIKRFMNTSNCGPRSITAYHPV
jgi:predicted secreted protein